MKSYFLISTFLLVLFSDSVFAQEPGEVAAISYLDSLLKPGSRKVEILEKEIPADLKKIILTYRQAVADNLEWFNIYSQENKDITPLPYHENFGISPDDYTRMNYEFPKLRMKVKSVKTVQIEKEGNKINFIGDENFTVLDAIVIDLNNKVIIIDEQLIPFSGAVREIETPEYGSWSGYRWKLEIGSMEDVKAFKNTDYTMIEFAIGKVLLTNKTVIQYKTISVEGGSPKINGAVTAYLN